MKSLSFKKRYLLLILLSLNGIFVSDSNAQQNCNWDVRGSILSTPENTQMSNLGFSSPALNVNHLSGVKVRVRLRSRNGVAWRILQTVRTNSLGNFSAVGTRRCDRAYAIQVHIQFSDSTMTILGPNGNNGQPSLNWYQVFSDIDTNTWRTRAGINDLDTITIPFPTQEDFNNIQPTNAFLLTRHAQIWTIYRLFLNRLSSFGSAFSYPDRLIVKYPNRIALFRNKVESYANPLTGRINILRSQRRNPTRISDQFSIRTLFHEAFHIWAYANFGSPIDRKVGLDETCLVRDLLQTLNTHDLNNSQLIRRNVSRCSAFHEGFADVAAQAFITNIFGNAWPVGLPISRSAMLTGRGGLDGDRLMDTEQLVRHDLGWQLILKTMMLDNLGEYDFQPRPSADSIFPNIRQFNIVTAKSDLVNQPDNMFACASRGLTIRNLLRLFMPAPNRGVVNQLRTQDLMLTDFLRRARLIFPRKITPIKISAIVSAVSPNSTTNPRDFLCNNLN